MLVKDHWYIACPSGRLEQNQPQAIQIGDDSLVVYRDNDGVARTLLDRCCHRGVKLSLGRITDGNIACGYHGWQYDGNGKLVKVPSLPEGAETPSYCVPSYVTMEADHYVWVWMPGEHTEPTYQPGISILDDIGGQWGQRTEIWDVNIMDAVENQLDFAHTPFSHPGTYPGHEQDVEFVPPLIENEAECRIVNAGIEAFGPPVENADDPMPSWRDLYSWSRFEMPYRNFVFLTATGALAIYNWVPLPDGKCRLEFMFTGQENVDGKPPAPCDGATKQVFPWDEEIELLNQDRVLLESARESLNAGRSDFEVSVACDFPQLQARRLHRAAMEGKLDVNWMAGKRHFFIARA